MVNVWLHMVSSVILCPWHPQSSCPKFSWMDQVEILISIQYKCAEYIVTEIKQNGENLAFVVPHTEFPLTIVGDCLIETWWALNQNQQIIMWLYNSDVTWESYGISNHQQLNCSSTACSVLHQRKHQISVLLALCEGNPPVTGGFPSQRASDAEIISILCYHHGVITAILHTLPPTYKNKQKSIL